MYSNGRAKQDAGGATWDLFVAIGIGAGIAFVLAYGWGWITDQWFLFNELASCAVRLIECVVA